MKKGIKVSLIIILLACVFTLNGCFAFDTSHSSSSNGSSDNSDNGGNSGGSSSGNTSSGNGQYNITVVYESETCNASFSNSANIKIEPRYKDDYILNGYYSSPNGGGNQYLNYMGESVTNSWVRGNTITLYPYYETIDNSYVYKSVVWLEEQPNRYSYNVYKHPTCASFKITAEDLGYIYKVAVSNPYKKMLLTGYADFYDEPTILSIGIGKDMSTGKLNEQTFVKTKSFETHSVSTEITGRSITNNKNNYILVGLFCNTYGAYGIAKNVYCEISFI